jgi:hypothetical protein
MIWKRLEPDDKFQGRRAMQDALAALEAQYVQLIFAGAHTEVMSKKEPR